MKASELLNGNHVDRAMHCIGLDYKKPYIRHGKAFYRPYRNYYSTNLNDPIWSEMYRRGFARHGVAKKRGGNLICTYYLTRDGLDWLEKALQITIYDEEE